MAYHLDNDQIIRKICRGIIDIEDGSELEQIFASLDIYSLNEYANGRKIVIWGGRK